MGEVFVIAAVSALDAGLLAAAVVMLGRPQPARQLLAYLIGGMGFSIIIGLLIFIAIAVAAGRRMQWHPRRTRNANHPPRQSLADRALGHDSLWIAWAAGALYSAPGAEYLAGLALLAKLNAPAAASVAAILGFNVIMFALIELPLLGLVLMPDRTRSLTEKVNAWMTAHRQTLIVIVAGAGGTYLLISGLTDLG